jgi:hypothetical protein
MLGAALAGRWFIGDVTTGHGAAEQLLPLAGSIVAGAAVGVAYFAWYFRRRLHGLFANWRVRLAVSA